MFFTSLVKDLIRQSLGENITTRQFIEYELIDWKRSLTRIWQLDGTRYYHYDSDINSKERTAIDTTGNTKIIHNLPNTRIQDNRYAFLVDQKANYLLAKPMEAKAQNKAQDDNVKNIFGPQFRRTLKNLGKDCLNCGISYLFPYMQNGQLLFKRFHGYEILPFWADDEHTQLDAAARLYVQEVYLGPQKEFIPCVEWYTADGVQKFTFKGDSLQPTDEDITPYIVVNDDAGQDTQGYNWGKIPLIAFKANEDEIPLIKRVKSLQDALNKLESDFADHMQEDAYHTILIVKNYGGQDLGEFRHNLATYGAAKVRDDGGVEALSVDVSSENYDSIINLFKAAIIENGRGLDMKNENMTTGTPNQMNIQSMYNDIDLDADEMEMEFQASMQQLMWFVQKANPSIGDVDFTFNRDRMMNETETINNCKTSKGIISDETIVSNHPWTDDTDEELKKLKAEQEEDMKQFGIGTGKPAAMPPQVQPAIKITDNAEV